MGKSGETFASWLKGRLQAEPRGTRTALAEAVPGLDRDKISKILSGKRRPQVEEVEAIRGFFKERDGATPMDAPQIDGANAGKKLGANHVGEEKGMNNDAILMLIDSMKNEISDLRRRLDAHDAALERTGPSKARSGATK